MSESPIFDALHTESLPSPISLKEEYPATHQQLDFVRTSRRQIEEILAGRDPRLLLIVGPCSIHDPTAALEYATKLRKLSDAVSRSFFIVMRTHFEKPRTLLGWKGMLYDPHLNNSHDIAFGLEQARSLLLALADKGIPTATEFLDPITPYFFGDLISWACIGARTSESQIHRQFASGLNMPVAFKNSTSGNIDIAIHGVLAASTPHAFFAPNATGHMGIVRTKGNAHAHVLLRGGSVPNYDAASIHQTLKNLNQLRLPERLLVDCSHGNSMGNPEQQVVVFNSILQQYLEGNTSIRGLMLESHLFGGCQAIGQGTGQLQYGVSITDPCLDWTTTEQLIAKGAAALEKKNESTESPCLTPRAYAAM